MACYKSIRSECIYKYFSEFVEDKNDIRDRGCLKLCLVPFATAAGHKCPRIWFSPVNGIKSVFLKQFDTGAVHPSTWRSTGLPKERKNVKLEYVEIYTPPKYLDRKSDSIEFLIVGLTQLGANFDW